MQRIFMLCMAMCTILTGFAQVDSTGKRTPDTIKIGGMVIIREEGANYDTTKKGNKTFRINSRGDQPSNISTNWWIMDIGFSNYVDNTNYPEAISSGILAPGMNEENFKAKAGKSRNINIWVLMQRLNIIKHVVNLKYGLGVELNNYHFEDKRVKFNTNPTSVDTSYTGLDKNKLAADYITFPLMINFNFAPDKRKNFGFSAGVSVRLPVQCPPENQDTMATLIKPKVILACSNGNYPISAKFLWDLLNSMDPTLLKVCSTTRLDLTPYNVGLRFSAW